MADNTAIISENFRTPKPLHSASCLRKVIWAVDPFSQDEALHNRTVDTLRALRADRNLEIEPVYVHNFDLLRLPLRTRPDYIVALQREAEEALEAVVSRSNLGETSPPLCLDQESESLSQRSAVKELVRHAKEAAADLIVLSTHSRRGISRWVLGSFAETLTLLSDVPVLVVGPDVKEVKRFELMIFPTDLRDEKYPSYEHTLELAAELNCRILLYHKVKHFPLMGLNRGVSPEPVDAVPEDTVALRKKALHWKDAAVRAGVPIEVTIDDEPGDAAHGILRFAKNHPNGLITIPFATTELQTLLLGSVTRQVIRSAPLPVWTIHARPVGDPDGRPLLS